MLGRELLSTGPEAFLVPTEVDTPSLLVDLDVLERNLAEMAEMCRKSNVSLMPHAKTHRTIELGRLQLAHGAEGLTLAKLGEAEAFAEDGVRRIVVAYPIVGRDKVARAAALARRCELTLSTDSLEGARAIGARFAESGRSARLYLIIDSGLHRCGVAPSDAPKLAAELVTLAGVQFAGIMTHEGSVYEARNPDELRRLSMDAVKLMTECAAAVRAQRVPVPAVSMGASASVRFVVHQPGVTEVRPGIYAFNDLGQIALENATPASCAVRVIATIVSNPEPGRACIDAGSKTLSQDRLPEAGALKYPGFGLLVDLPGWRVERLSEEHGWLRWHGPGSAPVLEIGGRVQIIPNHVCTVFSSLGECFALRNGTVVGHWMTLPPGASR